jgi:hypothetical protein
MTTSTVKISAFRGLNNVSDPARLGLGWLSTADNVDVTDTGALVQRPGYQLANAIAGEQLFSTIDAQRAYVVQGSVLGCVNSDLTVRVLAQLSGIGRMHWAELNEDVYFNNGVDRGVIGPDGAVRAWDWPAVPGAYHVCFA